MYILDSNVNLSRLGLSPDRETDKRWNGKYIWVKNTNLSGFDNIKDTLDSVRQDLGLTGTTITCNGKVLSIETGKILF